MTPGEAGQATTLAIIGVTVGNVLWRRFLAPSDTNTDTDAGTDTRRDTPARVIPFAPRPTPSAPPPPVTPTHRDPTPDRVRRRDSTTGHADGV